MARRMYRYTAKRKAALRKAQAISARKRRGSGRKKKLISAGVLTAGVGAAIIYGRKVKNHGGGPRDVINHVPSAAKRRVLVTGSRNLKDRAVVWSALDEQYRIHGPMTVVHGAHWSGADAYAAEWAKSAIAKGLNIIEDPHPAQWKRYKNAAGPIRNKYMVDLGADITLAFPRGKSSGTRNAMSLARIAGIKVREM